jgi:hypothetical protein
MAREARVAAAYGVAAVMIIRDGPTRSHILVYAHRKISYMYTTAHSSGEPEKCSPRTHSLTHRRGKCIE